MSGLLSVKEFCSRYAVGKTAAYSMIAAGIIDARKLGVRTVIPVESAEAWAASLPKFCSGAANARQPAEAEA